MEQKHPLPPFTLETAMEKIQMAEDAWNSQDPEKVSKAYTIDSEWRNRDTFVREESSVSSGKMGKELNYRLKKNIGLIQIIALQSVLNTNIRQKKGIG
jgi:nuclear transport factor 2 (NTF2) superfamily protein